MPFTRPSLNEIVDRVQSDLLARIDGANSLLRRSVIKVFGYVFAGVCHLLYGYLDYIKNQIFASYADTEYLDIIGAEYGVTRNAASKASGSGSTTGTNGTVIPISTELISDDGVVYETDAEQTVAAGTATLDFTAKDAGADGNDDASITLTFVSPISGLSSTLTVDADGIAGGADEEEDDDYRQRILWRKQHPPKGGCEADFIAWMKEISGVTRVWVFSEYAGSGTVGIAFTRDNDTDIIPSAAQRTSAEEYLVEHTDPTTGETVGVPVTCEPGLQMIALAEQSVNFTIAIYPNTTAVQNEIEAELENLFYNEGGPGQTIYLSQISEAISKASGEERHAVTVPATDQTFDQDKVPTVGTITWSSY